MNGVATKEDNKRALLAYFDHIQMVAEQHGHWEWARYYARQWMRVARVQPPQRIDPPQDGFKVPVHIPGALEFL